MFPVFNLISSAKSTPLSPRDPSICGMQNPDTRFTARSVLLYVKLLYPTFNKKNKQETSLCRDANGKIYSQLI